MGRPPLHIDVRPKDQTALARLLRSGIQPVRVVRRALVLQQFSVGASAPHIATLLPLTAQAIRRIGHRYQEGGLAAALYDQPRPGAAELLTDSQKQRIIALVCSDPPLGRARWSLRLIVQEAVKRRLVETVGRETIRLLLRAHDLKPWREKNVVRAGTGRRLSAPDGRRVGRLREALQPGGAGGVSG